MPTEPGATLIPIARAAISAALGRPQVAATDAAWLQEPGATFVTLTQRGQLRGCIGTLQAHRSVLEDVQANAVAAATRDPRFSQLVAEELGDTRIEVSLLSQMQPLEFASESEALVQLRPGIDGVLLEFGRHRSTFLPQVWEQLPDRREFIAQLKQKAGLPANFWADGMRLQRYTVAKWKEPELPQATHTETP
jgi:AmmeMemoRadiSam system protein A